jgi:hypothetical protein
MTEGWKKTIFLVGLWFQAFFIYSLYQANLTQATPTPPLQIWIFTAILNE